jgi:hypothetical protein
MGIVRGKQRLREKRILEQAIHKWQVAGSRFAYLIDQTFNVPLSVLSFVAPHHLALFFPAHYIPAPALSCR